MLHNIDDKVYRCEYGLAAAPDYGRDYALCYKGDKLLLKGGDSLPRLCDVVPEGAPLQYLFSISGESFFLCREALPEGEGFSYEGVQKLRQLPVQWMAFAGVTGYHLSYWYEHNKFCGACGAIMQHKDDERAVICPKCGNIVYPCISPAVIIGITNGDKLLLARYMGRPVGNYALIAGFVEIGETLEDTVRREVMEEVGLKVKNIRYYGNQPWGFSRSLLVGFFVELDGSPEVTVDNIELAEAVWMDRGDIKPGDTHVSLTSTMIEAFRTGQA